MKSLIRGTLLIVLFILLMPAYNSLAWNSTGHMIVASIAYRELPANKQRELVQILTHHSDYDRWNAMYTNQNIQIDKGEFLFMEAGVWPDKIRRTGSPYDHPEWHFVDYKIEAGGQNDTNRPSPDNDIILAIDKSIKSIDDPQAPPEARAAYLSWLIHLMGDLHQPLHCASFYSSQFPKGDRGSNLFWVIPNQAAIKLHSFWDGLMGKNTNPRVIHNEATLLMSEYPASSFSNINNPIDVTAISLESFQIAFSDVYQKGTLKGGNDQASAVELPNGYSKYAKSIAEKQIVLSGYRLTNVLEHLSE